MVWMNGDQRKVVNSAEKSYTDFVIEKTKGFFFFLNVFFFFFHFLTVIE